MEEDFNYYHKSNKDYNRDFDGYCRILKGFGDKALIEFRDEYTIPRSRKERYIMMVYIEDLIKKDKVRLKK